MPMGSDPVRIIVVEDDDDLRESVKEFLTRSGYLVTAVGTGRAFYRALDEGSYTIAVIDIGLPDQSGLVLAEYLRANTGTGIIIMTARDGEEDQLQGYDAGADLYLTKPVTSRVLCSAISRLTDRLTARVADEVVTSHSWGLCKESWSLTSPGGQSVQLTSLEYRFIEFVAMSAGQQASRDHLQSHLYRYADEYTGRALDALVRRLRSKLGTLPGPANPIKNIYGVGYCFSEQITIC